MSIQTQLAGNLYSNAHVPSSGSPQDLLLEFEQLC